jgi:uncharacterized protein (TIGR03435 family)
MNSSDVYTHMRPSKLGLLIAAVAIGIVCAQTSQREVFEVASIKPNKDEGTGPRNGRTVYTPTGLEMRARTLGFIIGEAYAFPVGRIVPAPSGKDEILVALRQGYDMIGKVERAASKEDLRLMAQSLLADRFQLTLHRESRTQLVYKLVEAKGGAKLSPADGGELVMSGSADGYTFRNAEVFRLCGYLGSYADRVVVDETGLKGLYNFTVRMPEDLRRGAPMKMDGKSPDSVSAATFDDVLRPLGMKLAGATAAVEYLVIDRLLPLTEN